ncbi:MAG: hypothetical protein SCALA702_07490 [Melioribacteraceae bacterium]|nr:MAG: hypothetical protein SCALA702_07490 [Melioribacteraceae bacterium]
MKEIEEILRHYTFENFAKEDHKIYPADFFSLNEKILLDVRSKEEMDIVKFPLKDISEVIEIPVYEIPDRHNEIPQNKTVGIFCAASIRATMVFLYLKAKGYNNVKILAGGYDLMFPELKPGKLYKSQKL